MSVMTIITECLCLQVMSESVASALEYLNNDSTKETRLFIRMMDHFFDYLNVRFPKLHQFKRKDSISPYTKPTDERFTVCTTIVNYNLK